MNKQTAVEWLIKEFSDILGPIDTEPMQDLLMMDAMKKAKKMEHDQWDEEYFRGYNHGYEEGYKDGRR